MADEEMTRISPLDPYEIEVQVAPEDIDQLGHVNNVVYLRWVQDAAVAHWFALATEEQKAALLWVVAKHEIEYKRPAYEAELLTIRTWVGKASSRLFERHTRILRKEDGSVLAKALSVWVPVDIQTKKPVRVGADVYALFST